MPLIFSALCLACLASPLSAAPSEPPPADSEIAKMVPFQVRDNFWGDYEADIPTQKMLTYTLTWVSPAVEKAGLRIGDRLVSINGVALKEFSLDQFGPALDFELNPGEKCTLVFTGKRGFLHLSRTITVVFTKRAEATPAVEPASSP